MQPKLSSLNVLCHFAGYSQLQREDKEKTDSRSNVAVHQHKWMNIRKAGCPLGVREAATCRLNLRRFYLIVLFLSLPRYESIVGITRTPVMLSTPVAKDLGMMTFWLGAISFCIHIILP